MIPNTQNRSQARNIHAATGQLKSAERAGRLLLTPVAAFTVVVMCILAQGAFAQQADVVNPQTQTALLAEDWSVVLSLLDKVDATSSSPPELRLIKAHASMATNANNEALCLFLSLRGNEQAEACYNWAKTFQAAHQDNPIACYLAGDALARLDRADEAIEMFQAGLKQAPKHPFCEHACGVVYAMREDWDSAKDYLKGAQESQPGRAEFVLSYANYLCGKHAKPELALKSYEDSLALSPDYVIALNGVGNMQRILKEWDKANNALTRAADLATGCLEPVVNLIATNLLLLGDARGKEMQMLLAEVTGVDPGTDIGEAFKRLSPGTQQRLVDGVANNVDWQKPINSHLPDKVSVGAELQVGVSPVGLYVQGGPKAEATWNMKENHAAGIGRQEAFLNKAKQECNITPNETSNAEGWLINHDPQNRAILDKITNGGVDSDNSAQTQNRNWTAATLYGLLYANGKETAN